MVRNGDEVSFMETTQIVIFYAYMRVRERYNIKPPRVAPVCIVVFKCGSPRVRRKSAVTGIYPKLLHANLVRGALITLSLLAACVSQRIL